MKTRSKPDAIEPAQPAHSRPGQEKLQQEEALLQLASRLTHVGGWQFELAEERTVWSDEVAIMYGLAPGTVLHPDEAMRFCVPESRATIRKAFDACMHEGIPYDLELQIITVQGRRVWMRAIGQAVRDANGAITRLQGAFQDITEKKRIEADLQRLTLHTANILESITDGFCTLDRAGRFTYVNKKAEQLLHRARGDLLGKVLLDAFPQLIGTTFDRELHRAMRDNCPVSFQEFCEPFNIWADIRIFPSENGLALYFLDITQYKLANMALRASEERFSIVAKVVTDTIYDWDLETDTIWWSDGMYSVFGYPREELETGIASWTNRVHPDDKVHVVQSFYESIAGRDEQWSEEYRFLRKDGTIAYVQDRSVLLRAPDGKAVRLIGTMVDITDRKRVERERQEAEARIRSQASLLDKAHDAISVTDMDSRITFWNKGAERLYGWTEQEALGKTKAELIVDDPAAFDTACECVRQNGEWRGEIMKRHKGGRKLTIEGHWTLVRDDHGRPNSILAIDTDISQRKAAEREIEHLAFFDTLTRLPNRRLLLDRLQHALAASNRNQHAGALLFIDLDNFKALNDTLGHDKGDLLLQQVARRLEACVPRKSDTVARLGGDEFVVMLEDLNPDLNQAGAQADHVSEKILSVFTQPFNLGGHEHHSSPSIGVALFDHQVRNVDELLKRADLAMYQAKAAGRNTIRFFDPNMQTAVSARVALETDLRQGLRQNEFFLCYQRQTDASGRATGAEALLRWHHPQRGIVPPAQFIPLAEETGLIIQLGQWVLETACKQLTQWAARPETAGLSIAVNVSARQFRHPDFVKQVMATLASTGADPRKLKLEITESLLASSIENMVAKMTALKEIGVSFALDDFGTGYSSLSYLKRLPLDQLKIDKSFVKDIVSDPDDKAIACTIMALGQTLGLEVIAEGVETEEQRLFLAEQGCNAYQGFLFSPPLPAEQF